jgi:hypothetical protein
VTPVRLAELVAAVSVATDISMCHPVETGLTTCVTATRLARRAGAGGDDLAAAYYLALDHIGCTAGNLSFATYVGDEMAFRESVGTADATEPRVMGGLMMRSVFGDGVVTGVRRLGRLAGHPADFVRENVTAVCEIAQRLTGRLGVGPLLHDGLAALPARYDGKGQLSRVPREQVPLAAQVVHLAQVAVLASHDGGPAAAVAAVRGRRGRALFPDLADAPCAAPGQFLPGDGEPLLEIMLGLEPGRAVVLDDEGLDEGLHALAEFTDLKAPRTAGHSRAVAGLAAAAAQQCWLPGADVALVRRAGWIHDLGRVTVSAAVWEKARRPDPR